MTTATLTRVLPIGMTDLEYWQERDRLHVALKWKSGEFKDGKVIAEWWDEDATSMFEGGFFSTKGHVLGRLLKDGPLHESVYAYCEEMGILPADPRLRCADCSEFFVIRSGHRVTKRDREYFQCEYCVENDQKARPTELTAAQWRRALESAKRFEEAP